MAQTPARRRALNVPASHILCLVAVIGIYLAMAIPMMEANTNCFDEGCLLVYPELLHKGLIAQRDFQTPYPPGNIWFLAGAYSLMGTDIFSERTVGMLYHILLLCGIYWLCIGRGRTVAMAASVLSVAILLCLGLYAAPWMGGLAFSVLALAFLTQTSSVRARTILPGVFAALAVMWRLDLAPALVLALFGYCLLAKRPLREWAVMAVAGGVTLLPLVAHVIIVGPSLFFHSVFLDPVILAHNARSLPLDFSGAYGGQLYALVILSIFAMLAVGWELRANGDRNGAAMVSIGLFTLGILEECLQRPDAMHLTMVATFAIPMLLLTAASISKRPWIPLLAFGACMFALPQDATFLWRAQRQGFSRVWVKNGDRQVTGSIEEQAVIDYLDHHAKAGQRLFVGVPDMRFAGVNNVAFYHLFPELRPASYFIEFNPQISNRPGSRLASDIATSDWVVIDRTVREQPEPNASAIPGPDAPNAVLRQQFHLELEIGQFSLYRRI